MTLLKTALQIKLMGIKINEQAQIYSEGFQRSQLFKRPVISLVLVSSTDEILQRSDETFPALKKSVHIDSLSTNGMSGDTKQMIY